MSEDSQTLHHPTAKPLFSADVMTPCMLVSVWPHYQASFCYKLPYKVSLCSHTSDCWLQKSHRQRGPKIDSGGTPRNQICLRVCTRSRGEAEKGGIVASHVSCAQPNIRLPTLENKRWLMFHPCFRETPPICISSRWPRFQKLNCERI